YPGEHLAIYDAGEGTAHVFEHVRRLENVPVTGTGNHKVVCIVRDTGSYRAFAQAKAFDQPQADIAACMVSLNHYQLEDIPRGVGHDHAILYTRLLRETARGDLPRLDAHDLDHTGPACNAQHLLRDISDMHGSGHPGGRDTRYIHQQRAFLCYELAVLVDRFDLKSLQFI